MTRYRPIFFGDAPLYDSECKVDLKFIEEPRFVCRPVFQGGGAFSGFPRIPVAKPPPENVINIASDVRFEIDDERFLEAIKNQQHRVKYLRVELEGGHVIEVGERPTNEFIDEAESVII